MRVIPFYVPDHLLQDDFLQINIIREVKKKQVPQKYAAHLNELQLKHSM